MNLTIVFDRVYKITFQDMQILNCATVQLHIKEMKYPACKPRVMKGQSSEVARQCFCASVLSVH